MSAPAEQQTPRLVSDSERPGAGVGAILRGARLSRDEELREVASALRIRLPYLQAIEDGKIEDLPGVTYGIGFVRAYADYLDLDTDDIVARFKGEASGINRRTQLQFPEPLPGNRVPGGALLLIVLLLAGGVYGGWLYTTSQDMTFAEAVEAVPERLQSLIEGDAPPTAETAPVVEEEVAATPAPSPEPVPAAEPASEPAPEPMVAADTTADSQPADPQSADPQSADPQSADSQSADSQSAEPETADSEGTLAAAPTSEAGDPPAEALPVPIPETPAPAIATTPEAEPVPAPAPEPEPAAEAVPEPQATVPMPEPAPEPEPSPAADSENVATTEPAPEVSPEVTPDVASQTAPEPAAAASTDAAQPGDAPAPPAIVTEDLAPPDISDAAEAPTEDAPPPSSITETELAAPDPAPADAPAVDPQPAPPVAESSEAVAEETETQTAAAGGPRIIIQATAESWVQVRASGGEVLVEKLMLMGEIFRVPNRTDLTLSTTNAGALKLIVDGTIVPPLGDSGAIVRDVALTEERLLP